MAQTAIDKLNDTTLDNRLIFVREDREPEKPTAPTAVFVTNVRIFYFLEGNFFTFTWQCALQFSHLRPQN